MKIKALTLKNFKGIKELVINAEGENLSMYGDNATGKTSVADSFSWLLFGKDSLNRKDFGIKPYDGLGDVVHNLQTEVEGIFTEPNITLKRVYYEKYTKKRGQATEEFTGNTTDYFVDDVPCSEKEFKSKIDSIIIEENFKLLTNPLYFNTALKWEQRRKILMDVCGTVTDTEIIHSNDELKALAELLGNRSVEDHKAVVKAKLTKINDELKFIPTRIDEVLKSIEDTSNFDKTDLHRAIATLEAKKKKKQDELSLLENGGEATAIKLEIANIEASIQKVVNSFEADKAKKRNEANAKQLDVMKKISNLKVEKLDHEGNIEINTKNIIRWENEASQLREQFKIQNERIFETSIDCTCPTCKQSLPESTVEEARQKALEAFNLNKSNTIESIRTQGKDLVSNIDKLKQKIAEQMTRIEKINAELTELDTTKQLLLVEECNKYNVEDVPEFTTLFEKKEALQKKLETTNPMVEEKQVIKDAITAIDTDISEIKTNIAKIEANEKSTKRAEELRAEEKKLAGEYQDWQRQLFLIETFVKRKCDMVSEQINSKFKLAKFKLFETQINGGILETCEVVSDGVPYSDLNNAMKINIGLDIINTLSRHYGINAPVFVDNAESVVNLEEMESQLIRLVVSEAHKKLEVMKGA